MSQSAARPQEWVPAQAGLLPVDDSRAEPRKGWRHKDAVALLRRLIEIGDLAPGERLREVVISQRLGMSRTPVREAFRTLAAEGLVELLPNRSVVVSAVDLTDVEDVYAVLGLLEGLASVQACERATDGQIRLLGELQEQLERFYGVSDRENYVNTNRRIHELIVEASHNTALLTAWRTILPRAERVRNTNKINRTRWTESVYEHRLIFAALAERDSSRIAGLLNNHFRNGLAHALAHAEASSSERSGPGADAP
jgi:DNA-binding GntR family transcriptional regulator